MNLLPSIFKAYDVRGVYPKEINEAAVSQIVGALGGYFSSKKRRSGKIHIVLGHDARLSSPKLYQAALEGITSKESKITNKKLKNPFIVHSSSFIIHCAGLISTPMLYFLVGDLKAAGGIMITASHNPKEYNGLKVVGPKAAPILGDEVRLITESGITV